MSRIVVDLPAPFGPRNPVTRPGLTVEADVVDGGLVAVPLGQSDRFDHPPTLGDRESRHVIPSE